MRDFASIRRGKRRFDDDETFFAKLLRRHVPQTARSCLLAAKRYRSAEHRMFHRWSSSPGTGWPTATCRPTTCWCTRVGSC